MVCSWSAIDYSFLEDVQQRNSMNQHEIEHSDKRTKDEALSHMVEESPLDY